MSLRFLRRVPQGFKVMYGFEGGDQWSQQHGGTPMLVLSRKEDQSIEIGKEIVITVLSIDGGRVRLGISAPPDVKIRREELPHFHQDGESEG